MFKKIVIQLDGPICTCENENLAWTVYLNKNETNCFLLIFCLTCQTKLEVPNKKFVACFELKKQYPKGVPPQNKSEINPETEKDQKFLRDIGIVPNFKVDE